jgi:hypothetical protein
LTVKEILYILLSKKEVKNKYSFLAEDLKIIRTLEGMKIRFNTINYLQLQTLRERGISRGCWKWILKYPLINTSRMRTSSC